MAVGIWAVFVAVLSQFGGWITSQLLLALGLELPGITWPIIGAVAMLLAGAPALALALIPRYQPAREAGRVWSIGAVALGLGTGLRAIPGTENEWYLFALAVWAGLAAVLLRRRSPTGFSLWGVVAGLLVLAPFLWVGALGGWLDTLLAIAAAVALGALVASILDDKFWDAFEPGKAKRIMLGGLVAGVTLALVGAGAGGDGAQLLLLVVLPPLGFAAAALRNAGPLIGIAAFGPLAFFDPVEINIFLIEGDVPFFAIVAGAVAWIGALVAGLFYGLGSNLLARTRQPVAAVAATVVALGAGALYAFAGQPGLYGDQLFVVLKEQASLEGLPTTTGLGSGRDARVAAVYQRLVEHAERTQAPLRAELERFRLGYQPYYLINAIRVAGGPEVRAWLELRDDVDRVLLDQRLRPLPRTRPATAGAVKEPPDRPQWNIEMVGAPEVWQRGQGKGIVVGTSDSGVDGQHPALAPGYRGGDDSWYDPWDGTTFPVDSQGHGTHTLGTAVGGQLIGVAPEAQWIGCVNLDRNMGSPSYYLDCMQFMLAPFAKGGNPFKDGRPARAAHVLTNSWGCPALEGCDIELTRPATDALAAAGIAFVAAAGNEGPRCGSIDDPPAVDPSAFTVAAVNEQGAITDFSSRGQPASGKPDVAAPGAQVLSAMPHNTYDRLDGTSMATPHVAGVIALLWSVHPELVGDIEGTYSLLRGSATPVEGSPTCGDLEDGGAGIVNAARAVQQAGA